MIYENELVISKQDYENYKKGVTTKKIDGIFKKIVSDLPDDLKVEALKKGIRLVTKDKKMGVLTLLVEIPSASKSLQQQITTNFPFIVCAID